MESDASFSEAEDDLPSYSFVSSQSKERNCVATDDGLSAAEVIAKRSRNEEMFRRLGDIKNFSVAQSKQNLNTHTNHGMLFDDDEETKEFMKQAEELKVQSTTLYYIPDFEFLKAPSSSLFSHETLRLDYFLGEKLSLLHHKMRSKDVIEELVRNTDLEVIPYPKEVQDKLSTYLFYLMSVHPDFCTVEGIYYYLIQQTEYHPVFSDVINILRNWGADLHDMLTTASLHYTGLHPSLIGCEPRIPIQVQPHNIQLLLKYLIFVLKTVLPTTYADLLKPMLLFSVNVNTYLTNIKISVCEIVYILSTMKNVEHSLENVHQRNLSLRNQFFLCTKSLACTPLQLPMAFATLQQFLEESDIVYCKCHDIDSNTVFNLISRKRDSVLGKTFNDASYVLKLIDLLVRKTADTSNPEDKKKFVNEWLSLLRDLSLEIQESDRLSDPVLLKDQIAQMSYDLRINLRELNSSIDT